MNSLDIFFIKHKPIKPYNKVALQGKPRATSKPLLVVQVMIKTTCKTCNQSWTHPNPPMVLRELEGKKELISPPTRDWLGLFKSVPVVYREIEKAITYCIDCLPVDDSIILEPCPDCHGKGYMCLPCVGTGLRLPEMAGKEREGE